MNQDERIKELEFALDKLSDIKNPQAISKNDIQKLTEPTRPEEIEWRIQSVGIGNNKKPWALIVPYLDRTAVMNRLDNTIGADRWSDSYTPIPDGFICTLSIYTPYGWISKSDAAGYTNIESVKGGLSDSFKRAANKWGIGRDLADRKKTYADIAPQEPEQKDKPNWNFDKKHNIWWKVPEFNLGETTTTKPQTPTTSKVTVTTQPPKPATPSARTMIPSRQTSSAPIR